MGKAEPNGRGIDTTWIWKPVGKYDYETIGKMEGKDCNK